MVFGDYSTDSFALANAKISNINLYKKTNKLELFVQPEELIPVSEIDKFETYAKKRFNLNEVKFKFKYISDNNIEEINKKITEDWNQILSYTSKRMPIIKAFLKNSNINVDENKIDVNIAMKGKLILEKQGIDKYISEFIYNVYGKKFAIKFIENNVQKAEDSFIQEKQNIVKQFAEHSAKVEAFIKENHKNENKQTENAQQGDNANKKSNSNWKMEIGTKIIGIIITSRRLKIMKRKKK